MKVVVCEKPSVAVSVANVIGANQKCNGYIQGKDYIVTWCYGHLLELVNPSLYDEKYKKWSIDTLPIVPTTWRYGVKNSTKSQYDVIKELFARNDVDSIVIATDAGREGESIARNVYHKLGCRKTIFRLWISSLEDSAIRDGFKNLRPGAEFDNLYNAAKAREHSDWLVGINLSRLFTLIYGGGAKLSIGRVMTPTLAMICERDDKIRNFEKEKYFVVHLKDGSGIDAVSEKIEIPGDAQNICNKCNGKVASVESIEEQNKQIAAPLLYDLTSLQRDCNKFYGYSAQETLDIAQELYEKKLTTYPRTDAKYLSDDMYETALKSFDFAKSRFDFIDDDASAVNVKRIIDNSKISDHHAIIPTGNISALSSINDKSRLVYDLICIRMVLALSEPYIYKSTKLQIDCMGEKFKMVGQVTLNEGYRRFESSFKSKSNAAKEKENEVAVIPDVSQGFSFAAACSVEEKYTKPLPHFTEDTLLDAMDKAGNKEMSDEVERKGLGTSATRAGVIEKLIDVGYVMRDKKKLIATDDGKYLISVVPSKIKSVEMTCDWENDLLEVSKGSKSYQQFIDEINVFIKTLIDEHKNVTPKARVCKEAEIIAKCPVCQNSIIEGKFGLFCTGKCGLSLKFFGKPLSKEQTKKLFAKEKIFMKGVKSSKGTVYDAFVSYDGFEPYSYDKEGETKQGYNLKFIVDVEK